MMVDARVNVAIGVALDNDEEGRVKVGSKHEMIEAHVVLAHYFRSEGEPGVWFVTATGPRIKKDGNVGVNSVTGTIDWDDVPWKVRVAIRDHITAFDFVVPPEWAA